MNTNFRVIAPLPVGQKRQLPTIIPSRAAKKPGRRPTSCLTCKEKKVKCEEGESIWAVNAIPLFVKLKNEAS
jgi:hypothetical protein